MKEKFGMRAKFTLTLAVLIGMNPCVSSCSNMSDSLTKVVSTVGTAVGAGAAGYGVTKLAGGSDSTAWVVGGIAAVAGAFTGYQWGNSIVKRRSEYRTSQEYISDNQKQMKQRINQARRRNSEISGRVASAKRSSGKITRSEKQQTNAELTRNMSLIDQDISNARRARAEASGRDKEQLDRQIQELSAEKRALKRNQADFSSIATI